jgi:hypothetical protein
LDAVRAPRPITISISDFQLAQILVFVNVSFSQNFAPLHQPRPPS